MDNEININDIKEILELIKIDIEYHNRHGLDNSFNFELYEYYSNKLENLMNEC